MRMWSSRKEMEHVIRLDSVIISINQNLLQNYLYLFTKAEIEFSNSYN